MTITPGWLRRAVPRLDRWVCHPKQHHRLGLPQLRVRGAGWPLRPAQDVEPDRSAQPKGPEWANMGRAFIKGILNPREAFTLRTTRPDATGAAHQRLRRLDGIEFVAKVEMEKDQYGEDKNVVKTAITPDSKDYAGVMGRVAPQPSRTRHPAACHTLHLPAVPAGRSKGGGDDTQTPSKAVRRARCRALEQHGNTLGVAPTGAGKTIMLSGVAGSGWPTTMPRPACWPTATS